MKKIKNTVFHAFYLLLISCALIFYLCTLHKSMDKVEEYQEISAGYHTGSHYGRTQDANLYNIDYEWYIDHNISEEDNLKIDLVIKRTLAKSFQYYTTEQLLAMPNDATTDIKNRIEDAVFALQPYGWHLSKLSIYPEK